MSTLKAKNTHESSARGQSRPSRLPRMQTVPRVTAVAEQLRAHILAGGFSNGGILPSEGDLAGILGVSRTVVREALRILQAEGLVEISHGRRPRVKPVDAQAAINSLNAMFQRVAGSLDDLLEVRRALETEIAVLAVERAREEHLEQMASAIEQLRASTDLEESVRADVLFHQRLAEATGNRFFELLLETVSGVLHETVWRTLPESGNQPAIDGHEKILAAVRARDPVAARAAVIEHLEWVSDETAKPC